MSVSSHMTISPDSETMLQEASRPRIQSVARALSILLEIARAEDGLTAKDLSRILGLQRQTTYHLLHTLREAGFVEKGRGNRYELGTAAGTISEAFHRKMTPPTHLLPLARSIATATGEATYIAGWHRGEVTVLSYFPGQHNVRVGDLRVGVVGDAHARASGKALLALSPRETREAYLATHPLTKRTANTIVDREALEKDLDLTRDRGYALDLEEFAEDICCVSVPVDGGASPYVISVATPKSRFQERGDDYIAIMLGAIEAKK